VAEIWIRLPILTKIFETEIDDHHHQCGIFYVSRFKIHCAFSFSIPDCAANFPETRSQASAISLTHSAIFIPVTRRVKGYTRLVGKYVTGRRKRFWPHKVYMFLIRITSRVDLAIFVWPSVLLNAGNSETLRAIWFKFQVLTPTCHAHSDAHKPPNCGFCSYCARNNILTEMYWSRQRAQRNVECKTQILALLFIFNSRVIKDYVSRLNNKGS